MLDAFRDRAYATLVTPLRSDWIDFDRLCSHPAEVTTLHLQTKPVGVAFGHYQRLFFLLTSRGILWRKAFPFTWDQSKEIVKSQAFLH